MKLVEYKSMGCKNEVQRGMLVALNVYYKQQGQSPISKIIVCEDLRNKRSRWGELTNIRLDFM